MFDKKTNSKFRFTVSLNVMDVYVCIFVSYLRKSSFQMTVLDRYSKDFNRTFNQGLGKSLS